jgi:hypothetical protein
MPLSTGLATMAKMIGTSSTWTEAILAASVPSARIKSGLICTMVFPNSPVFFPAMTTST